MSQLVFDESLVDQLEALYRTRDVLRRRALPLEDTSVDRALCVQVLEYVADVGSGLAELHRIVRPGGRVVQFCFAATRP